MKSLVLYACILTMLAFFVMAVPGQSPLPFRLQSDYLTGLARPVHLTNAGDGSRRLFIVQQRGIIKVVQPVTRATSDFLNISAVVSSTGNERGLLGLAFHPEYSTNRRFFVYYTRQSDGAIEIAEYRTSAGDPNQAEPNAVRIILTIPHPSFSNHNGGTVAFGPDGFLYAATGDGGSGNDPFNNAQNINSLLGKVLRIDINTPIGQVPPYNIPPTNPYAGAIPGLDEIYAIGMRNPYRFSFDRAGTHQLWVGDVGQDAIEEVDIITLGGNYGWRVYEGNQCTGNDPGLCNPANYLPPVFQYSSSGAGNPRCSVTGGYVYRGHRNAMPRGAYLYGDYCSGEILMWHNGQQVPLLDSSRLISSFGEDEDGELYVIGLGSGTNGTVDRILGNETSADFDGDLRTDISVFRPNTGEWFILNSSNMSVRTQLWGSAGDIPVPEDFDGDHRADIGVYRPSQGAWYVLLSSDNTFYSAVWGSQNDVPVASDYDVDGIADVAVFRPNTGEWFINNSSDNSIRTVTWGGSLDDPMPGDYDGDGRTDIVVFRESTGTWYGLNSSDNSFFARVWGQQSDTPIAGDFDADGRNDLAVYRPTSGFWYILRSGDNGFTEMRWGSGSDVPVVGDYDRDGRDDIAVWRPLNGTWYVLRSSDNGVFTFAWGGIGDIPIPPLDTP